MLRRANEALQAEIIVRKQYEQKERLLIREINHRAKNMLTVVDAIARQTAATSPEDFRRALFRARSGTFSQSGPARPEQMEGGPDRGLGTGPTCALCGPDWLPRLSLSRNCWTRGVGRSERGSGLPSRNRHRPATYQILRGEAAYTRTGD
jgi:HWE histidine kinase